MSITKFQRLIRGPIAWALVIAIAISFSFFGTQGALNIFAATDEFTVDGVDAVVPFLFAMNNLQSQLENRELTEEQNALFQQQAQASAIRYSIEQTLLANFVDEQDMSVSEQEIYTQIASGYVTEVETNAPVTKQEILAFLTSRTSVDGLRAIKYLQKQEAQSRFFDRTINSEFMTDSEGKLLKALEQELRDIELIVLSPKNFINKVAQPTREEMLSIYTASVLRFTLPPRLDSDFLVIDKEQIVPIDTLDQAAIETKAQEIYDNALQSASTSESKISILALDPEFTEDMQSAMTTLESSLNAENFAEQAMLYSTDISAEEGGDIGWIAASDFPEEFQQAVINLPVGSVSSAVELNDLTYFIFKQEERLNIPDLITITEQVTLTTHAELIQREYPRFIANLEDLIYDGSALEDIAAEVNLTTINVNEIFANSPNSTFVQLGIWEPLLTALSIDDNDNNTQMLGPWQNDEGQIIITQINNLTKADVIPFEEVSSIIKDELIEDQTIEMYQDSASQILEQLFAQKALKDIVEELEQSSTYRIASDISSSNSIFPEELTRNIFTFIPNDSKDWIEFVESEENTSYFVRVIGSKLSGEALDAVNVEDESEDDTTEHNFYRARLAIDSIVKQKYNQDDIVIFDRSILPENL